MKRFINAPDDYVTEVIDGILAAYPGELRAVDANRRVLVRADAPRPGKVAVVTGGGSGHLPLFVGYVGGGLCHGVAIGNVFSSPSPDQVLGLSKAVDSGAGVLYLYGNYSGDVLNFGAGAEMAKAEAIDVESVRMVDDVASAPSDRSHARRGVAGLMAAFKIVGAEAERGTSLPEVKQTAEEVVRRTRTMGVALAPCVLPSETGPAFELGATEMETGTGIHGEPGRARERLAPANEIADLLLDNTISELESYAGDALAVILNGMGGTPREELFILYRRIHEQLDRRGARIHRAFVGNYVTALGMNGCSLTLVALDEGLAELLDHCSHSPFFGL